MSNMDPLGKSSLELNYGKRTFSIPQSKSVLASNLIFDTKTADWYNKCNRYGWIDPFDHDRVTREFLFFTKPDLNIFKGSDIKSDLVESLQYNSSIYETYKRMPEVLGQLQNSVLNSNGKHIPFMYLLTNSVTSKLDLPGISADSQETTSNIMGTSIQYRGHSLKSDNGYDFSLSFNDTAYLEVYNLAKCYDQYMRMIKIGEASPQYHHIINRIIPEQFSIYKIMVGSDGETILYYAKLTGCYFTDVPRSDFGDPGDGGFKYSLSFHAQFVEDNNPYILTEFNKVSGATNNSSYMSVHSPETTVNNLWASYPKIIKAYKDDPVYGKRVARRNVNYDYFLKWVQ